MSGATFDLCWGHPAQPLQIGTVHAGATGTVHQAGAGEEAGQNASAAGDAGAQRFKCHDGVPAAHVAL